MHCPGGKFIFKKLSGRKILKLIKSGAEFKKLLLLWNLTSCKVSSETLWGWVPLPIPEGNFFHWHLCQDFSKNGLEERTSHTSSPSVSCAMGSWGNFHEKFHLKSRQDCMDVVFFMVWKKCGVIQQSRNGYLSLAVVPSHGYFIHIKTLTHVLLQWLTCLKWARCKYFWDTALKKKKKQKPASPNVYPEFSHDIRRNGHPIHQW